ncbi:hypothetical protein SAMN02799630_05905 [Paenibacillus sp. UNCCL117]|uniref:hypothetical protein n=1 Tax=unclassified Paenibacillus TaxID=185978 RepID=UPI0008859D20|nr:MULTISPECIES: hypothetical protein [unclassified Paenibacillus]SDE60462.1 hypothetical protein SAMN04488602_13525 [Paenibacillus sp. cl123]SFW69543.1 hypothetical protein SAMN02799630_05905 [Paenibacillus sp. UNCCL117]
MFRSPKEQIALMPELYLALGHVEEAAALISAERGAGSWSAGHSSPQEQLKRTPRKSYR